MSDLTKELDALTRLYEGGALLASSMPSEFIKVVREDVVRMREALAIAGELADAIASRGKYNVLEGDWLTPVYALSRKLDAALAERAKGGA